MVLKVVVRCEFEAGLRHATTVNQTVNGFLFRIREGKAAKGEGWDPPFISRAQDTVEL